MWQMFKPGQGNDQCLSQSESVILAECGKSLEPLPATGPHPPCC